jgi:phosphonate transport system substrate-binding protein
MNPLRSLPSGSLSNFACVDCKSTAPVSFMPAAGTASRQHRAKPNNGYFNIGSFNTSELIATLWVTFKIIFCIAFLLGGITATQAANSTSPTFVVGVLPIHSPRVLTERYEPLRSYLEKTLKRPVSIESAADFRRFQARSMAGDFDLSITPAHFARLLQREAGGQPLAQFAPDHDALLIYSREQPLTKLADLKGKQLAVIDRLAITVTAALAFLHSQGLEANHDYQVVEHRTHSSAAYSLISGMSAAAVTTSQGLLQMPDSIRHKLVVQKHIADIPAFVLIAKKGTARAHVNTLKQALAAFPNTPEGLDFLSKIGYSNLLPTTESSMKRADPYLRETIKALK